MHNSSSTRIGNWKIITPNKTRHAEKRVQLFNSYADILYSRIFFHCLLLLESQIQHKFFVNLMLIYIKLALVN